MAQVGEPLVDIEIEGEEVNDEVDNYEDKIEDDAPVPGKKTFFKPFLIPVQIFFLIKEKFS